MGKKEEKNHICKNCKRQVIDVYFERNHSQKRESTVYISMLKAMDLDG
jgi:hypothetical protein